jgi:DHA1 family quinolone resistance protein-like MFS transporter
MRFVINRTIRLLMISDIFVVTGFGLINPILAIYIKEDISGGTIFAAGLASTLFLITKSAVQLPFSLYVDEHDNRKRWLIVGTVLIALVPFLYIFAYDVSIIYISQVIYGIGAGLAFPTWLAVWSAHLDKKHESFEWSLYSTLASLGAALTAMVGAGIAQFIGFTFTFALVGLLSLIGLAILFKLDEEQTARIAEQKTIKHL